MIQHPDTPCLLQFECSKPNEILFFTTTRLGGISKPPFDTFNLGNYSDDDPNDISENRRRLAKTLGIEPHRLIVPKQVHGDRIATIDKHFFSLPPFKQTLHINDCDALITNQKEVCIGVTTADCLPVLLYDPIQQVIAAIHAGWRSTVLKIVKKTIDTMSGTFNTSASDLIAAIGPAIGQQAFEVGEEVMTAFNEAGLLYKTAFYRHPETGKGHINLSEVNRLQLIDCGVNSNNIETAELCTHSNRHTFFSARRDGIRSGRMVSGAVIR